MTVNFYLHKDPKRKQDELQIYCYVTLISKRIALKVGEKINPAQWNAKLQQARISYVGMPELNSMLNSIKLHIQKTYRLLIETNPKSNFDECKTAIQTAFYEKIGIVQTSNDFHTIFDMFLKVRSNEISLSMIKKYRVLHNLLKEFESVANYKISFKNLDMSFFDLFKDFLINYKKHSANTLAKDFDLLRTFCYWSVERKYLSDMTFEKFKSKTSETEIIALTSNELQSLIDLDLTAKPYLSRVRDVFVFACFTGLRFSDVQNLKRENIKNDVLLLRTQKTQDILKIPLLSVPKEILQRYESDPKPLPVISSQKTNVYLKDVARLAGLHDPIQTVSFIGKARQEKVMPKCELLSFHVARKTFVTIGLEKGMRPEIIMSITGHKDYKILKRYIKITETTKSNEINKWNKPQLQDLKAVL